MRSLLLKIIFLFFSFPVCMAREAETPGTGRTFKWFNDTLHRKASAVYLTDKITANDDRNIKSKAESVVKRFMNLLNTIATGLDLEVPETEGIIRKSYLPVETKIFYDSAIVVVDDLRKVETVAQAKEKAAHSYLRDFEIFYKKSEQASVFFSNFKISNVKKGNYLYIKVTYDCLFGNKSKISDEPYSVQQRVAELRVEKLNNKWKTWIIDVHFLDSLDIADAAKNDIEVVETLNSNTDSITADRDQENFVVAANTSMDPAERDALRRRNDSVRTYMAFRTLIDSGKHSLNKGQYILAYQFFNEAETVTNGSGGTIRQADVEFLQTMIREAKKNIAYSHRTPEEIFQGHIHEALLQRSLRNYDKALEAYSKAVAIKPADENTLQKKRMLSSLVSNLAAMEAKYTAGKYKEAINEYDRAIKSDPNNSDYYVGRGKCYEKTREAKKAMADYKRAIELDENHLQAYKEKGNLHAKQGDHANAIASYTICATKDKNDVAAFLRLADLNLSAGNQNAAIAALDKGIASNSSAAALHLKKGEVLHSMKLSARAIESFTTAIAFDSSNADLHFKRGLAYIDAKQVSLAAGDFARARRLGLDSASNNVTRQISQEFFNSATRQLVGGYHKAAITLLDQAILIDPYRIQYRFQRGQYYLIMKQPDAAIQNFNDVVAADPLNVPAFQLRGLAKHQKAQYQDAVADFNQAIRLNPRLPESYKYAGDALLKAGDYLNAIVSYDAALGADKSSKADLRDSLRAELYNGKGEANYLLGKYSVAMQNFNTAIKIEKGIPALYFNRGKTYLKLNELKEADENVRKALSYEPANALWIIKLGEIYFQQGKTDKAIMQYNLAIPKDSKAPVMPEALYQRAQCYVRMSNFSEAFKDLRAIQSAGHSNEFPDFNNDMGHLFLSFNQPDSAFKYFQKENGNASDPMSMYGMAIVHLQKNQEDQAFVWLERALSTKKIPKRLVSDDTRIVSMRGDKRYKRLIKKYY